MNVADNLAVSAQGFRRGANKVRKVRLLPGSPVVLLLTNVRPSCRTCGKHTLSYYSLIPVNSHLLSHLRWKDMKVCPSLLSLLRPSRDPSLDAHHHRCRYRHPPCYHHRPHRQGHQITFPSLSIPHAILPLRPCLRNMRTLLYPDSTPAQPVCCTWPALLIPDRIYMTGAVGLVSV
jgi:hypothetical protein